MWRVRYVMKAGEDKELIPASAYIEHTDGRTITMQFGNAETKGEARKTAQVICDALNFIAGHDYGTPKNQST